MNIGGLPLSPKQIRSVAAASQARISIWAGAVRSGKTIASLLAFLIALNTAPVGPHIVIIGRSLNTIERNLIDPLQDPALFGPVARFVEHTRGSTTATILGRTVHLIGASDVRSEGRIRGLTAYLIYIDEATLIPESTFVQSLARLSAPGAKLLATTNPDGPGHWLRMNYILRAGELGAATWHFVLGDNPALDPAYIAALKREYVGLWFRRFILGEWCLAEGAVYDMWDDAVHVEDTLPTITRWFGAGVDYGTTNPFSAIVGGIGTDRRLHLAAEYRYDSKIARRQKTDAEYSVALRDFFTSVPVPGTKLRGVRPDYVALDPSAASFLVQLYRDGMPGVVPADNAVVDGIRLVSSLLGNDKIRVHRSCRGLIEEIAGYAWDESAAEKGRDEPIKARDHSCDAMRYLIKTTEAVWHGSVKSPPMAASSF